MLITFSVSRVLRKKEIPFGYRFFGAVSIIASFVCISSLTKYTWYLNNGKSIFVFYCIWLCALFESLNLRADPVHFKIYVK